jgi:hypothetical protein
MYMVADVRKTGVSPKNEVIFQLSNERFVNSLSDIPELVSDVTILSTYFRSNPKNRLDDEENDLSVWFCDQYFEDADVSVGYRSRDFLCVAIPKTHELS